MTERWISQGYEDPKTGLTMHLPSIIDFKSDTITIRNANKKFEEQKVSYLVLSGRCDWDKGGLSGTAEYRIQTVSNNKAATIFLKATNGQGTLVIQMDDTSVFSPKLDIIKLVNE